VTFIVVSSLAAQNKAYQFFSVKIAENSVSSREFRKLHRERIAMRPEEGRARICSFKRLPFLFLSGQPEGYHREFGRKTASSLLSNNNHSQEGWCKGTSPPLRLFVFCTSSPLLLALIRLGNHLEGKPLRPFGMRYPITNDMAEERLQISIRMLSPQTHAQLQCQTQTQKVT